MAWAATRNGMGSESIFNLSLSASTERRAAELGPDAFTPRRQARKGETEWSKWFRHVHSLDTSLGRSHEECERKVTAPSSNQRSTQNAERRSKTYTHGTHGQLISCTTCP